MMKGGFFMKKMVIIVGMIFIILMVSSQSAKVVIPKAAIRFRVIASSNNEIDQTEKKKIAKQLSLDITQLLSKTNSIKEARKTLQNNISNFESTTKEIIDQDHYESTVNVDYGNHYFPEKEYKGVTYKEGEYESLIVTLGEGKGENFWCVLFPPLCLLEAEENETDEVEYKSFIKELIDKYF